MKKTILIKNATIVNESKRVEISSKDFEGKGSIYVILLKTKNVGVIRTGKVIKN